MPLTEHETWDAGAMGCGELVLELRMRLHAMPGRVLKLIATDAGALEDIPAYCRMTRNELVHAAPPEYWIRARTSN
jgi:tRNA 2-thiouridine synthesizing protein A